MFSSLFGVNNAPSSLKSSSFSILAFLNGLLSSPLSALVSRGVTTWWGMFLSPSKISTDWFSLSTASEEIIREGDKQNGRGFNDFIETLDENMSVFAIDGYTGVPVDDNNSFLLLFLFLPNLPGGWGASEWWSLVSLFLFPLLLISQWSSSTKIASSCLSLSPLLLLEETMCYVFFLSTSEEEAFHCCCCCWRWWWWWLVNANKKKIKLQSLSSSASNLIII